MATTPTTPDLPTPSPADEPIVNPPDVDLTDWEGVRDLIVDRAVEMANAVVSQLPLIVLAVVVLVVGLLLVGVAQRGVVRATTNQRMDPAVARLVQTLTRVAFVILVALLALSVAGVNIGSALAALGIAGLALAFAVQSILENFIAGILLLVRRPFRPGDQVKLGDFEGTVTDVDLRVTTLIEFDGEKVLLPNSTVFSEPIVNLTDRGARRTRVMVGVDYRDDHDRAREVLFEAVRGVEGVLSTPPPNVLLRELGESSVDFAVQFWTLPEQSETNAVRDRVLSAAKSALEREGMTIPWPIRTLVVDGDSATVRIRSRDREGDQ